MVDEAANFFNNKNYALMSNKSLKISSIHFEDTQSFEVFVENSTNALSDIIKSESSKKQTLKRKEKIKILKQSKQFISSFKR